MNADELILTIAYQATVIRQQAEEIARLRAAIAQMTPKAPEPQPPEKP